MGSETVDMSLTAGTETMVMSEKTGNPKLDMSETEGNETVSDKSETTSIETGHV